MIKYNHNGKVLNIPKAEIEKSMRLLELSQADAIQMWLEDEGYMENEEQENLCRVAKENKILTTIHGAGERGKKSKPKTVKISPEKLLLFCQIQEMLEEKYENVEILKENKLIQVKIGEKVLKIDLIEQRKAKK